jgi:hypothetical protein
VRYTRSSFLFTMASMIGTVNSVLGGALIALILIFGAAAPPVIAQVSGVVVGMLLLTATLTYERRRIRGAYPD